MKMIVIIAFLYLTCSPVLVYGSLRGSVVITNKSCDECFTIKAKNMIYYSGFLYHQIFITTILNHDNAPDIIAQAIMNSPLSEDIPSDVSYFESNWIKSANMCNLIPKENCQKINQYAENIKIHHVISSVLSTIDHISEPTNAVQLTNGRKLQNHMCSIEIYTGASSSDECLWPDPTTRQTQIDQIKATVKKFDTAYADFSFYLARNIELSREIVLSYKQLKKAIDKAVKDVQKLNDVLVPFAKRTALDIETTAKRMTENYKAYSEQVKKVTKDVAKYDEAAIEKTITDLNKAVKKGNVEDIRKLISDLKNAKTTIEAEFRELFRQMSSRFYDDLRRFNAIKERETARAKKIADLSEKELAAVKDTYKPQLTDSIAEKKKLILKNYLELPEKETELLLKEVELLEESAKSIESIVLWEKTKTDSKKLLDSIESLYKEFESVYEQDFFRNAGKTIEDRVAVFQKEFVVNEKKRIEEFQKLKQISVEHYNREIKKIESFAKQKEIKNSAKNEIKALAKDVKKGKITEEELMIRGKIIEDNAYEEILAISKKLNEVKDLKKSLKDKVFRPLEKKEKEYVLTFEKRLDIIEEEIAGELKAQKEAIKILKVQAEVEKGLVKNSVQDSIELQSVIEEEVRPAIEADIKRTVKLTGEEVEKAIVKKEEKALTKIAEASFELGALDVIMIFYGTSVLFSKSFNIIANKNALPNWMQAFARTGSTVFGFEAHWIKNIFIKPINFVFDTAIEILFYVIPIFKIIRAAKKHKAVTAYLGAVEYFDGYCWLEVHNTFTSTSVTADSSASAIVADWYLGSFPNLVYRLTGGNVLYYDYLSSTWKQLQDNSWSSPVIFLFANFISSTNNNLQVVAGLKDGFISVYSNGAWNQLQGSGYSLRYLSAQFGSQNNANELRLVQASCQTTSKGTTCTIQYYYSNTWNTISFNSEVSSIASSMAVNFPTTGVSTSMSLITAVTLASNSMNNILYYNNQAWSVVYSNIDRVAKTIVVQFPSQNSFNDLRIIAYFDNYEVGYYQGGNWYTLQNSPTGYVTSDSFTYPICVSFPTGYNSALSVEFVAPILDGTINYYSRGVLNQNPALMQASYSNAQVVSMKCDWQTTNPLVPPLRVVIALADGSVKSYPESQQSACWVTIAETDRWSNQLSPMQVSFSNLSPMVVGGLSKYITFDTQDVPDLRGSLEYFDGYKWNALKQGSSSSPNPSSLVVDWASSDTVNPKQVVYGYDNGAVSLYKYSTNTWSVLHDSSYNSPAKFLFADFSNSSNLQVMLGLGDQAVEYYNNNGWSELASSYFVESKSDIGQMATQFPNQNQLNDLRIIVAAQEYNANHFKMKYYYSGSWHDVTINSDPSNPALSAMSVIFPTDSSSASSVIISYGLGNGAVYLTSDGGSSWKEVQGEYKSKNDRQVKQMYMSNDNTNKDIRVVFMNNDGYIGYYYSGSLSLLKRAELDTSYNSVICPPNIPTGSADPLTIQMAYMGYPGISDATKYYKIWLYLYYGNPDVSDDINIPDDLNVHFWGSLGGEYIKGVDISQMQCGFRSWDSELPKYRVVMTFTDGSVQYMTYWGPQSTTGSNDFFYLQQPGVWNNQIKMLSTNFIENKDNFVTIVAPLSSI